MLAVVAPAAAVSGSAIVFAELCSVDPTEPCDPDPITCPDDSVIPGGQTCPPPDIACWDGSFVYDATVCPTQPSDPPAPPPTPPQVPDDSDDDFDFFFEEEEPVAPAPVVVPVPSPTPSVIRPTPTATFVDWQPPTLDDVQVSDADAIPWGVLAVTIVAILALIAAGLVQRFVFAPRRRREQLDEDVAPLLDTDIAIKPASPAAGTD
jgi:hypothetical protein